MIVSYQINIGKWDHNLVLIENDHYLINILDISMI